MDANDDAKVTNECRWCDDYWDCGPVETLCMPFSITEMQAHGKPGAGPIHQDCCQPILVLVPEDGTACDDVKLWVDDDDCPIPPGYRVDQTVRIRILAGHAKKKCKARVYVDPVNGRDYDTLDVIMRPGNAPKCCAKLWRAPAKGGCPHPGWRHAGVMEIAYTVDAECQVTVHVPECIEDDCEDC